MERTLDEWCRWYEKFYVFGMGNLFQGIMASISVAADYPAERKKHFKKAFSLYKKAEKIYEKLGLLNSDKFSETEKELLSCLLRCAFHIKKIGDNMNNIIKEQIRKTINPELVRRIYWDIFFAVSYGRIFENNLCGLMAVANEAAGSKKYECVFAKAWGRKKTEVRDVKTVEIHKSEILRWLKDIQEENFPSLASEERACSAGYKEQIKKQEQKIPLKNFWEWKITKPYF